MVTTRNTYNLQFNNKVLWFLQRMTNLHIMRKTDLVEYLKKRGLKSSFPKKAELLGYIKRIQWSLDFPWRDEQYRIISQFLDESFNIIALQGLFGCGKTTMLLGMLNLGFWKNKFSLDQICFCAFNVCIKNEIRKKIATWGVKSKPMVRTFDSLIYELCEFYAYPFLKKPNYEGKRRFILDICRQKNRKPFEKYDHIRFLFVDEAQDLEKNCFLIFQTFFKNAKMIFVGDIFQSIQKEPRESLLWWISHQTKFEISYYYMKETPRVPFNIFNDIKSSLIKFYPEYQEQINEWSSLNTESKHEIEWIAYDTYQDLYQSMFDFLDRHAPEKSMILTFSSCITVRGSLGDLARIRQLIEKKRPNIPLNSNYKNMDKSSLFLSTANSSKGLERENVFVISTFPLEKAFINFSRDLTMNLITVAISRAKDKAIVCVPKMIERFSFAFYSYPSSPKPNYTFFPSEELVSMDEFLNLEHTVTDILRQNVIKYDTRMHFQSFIKKTTKRNCMPVGIFHDVPLPKIILKTEEERAFVGVCVEVLMTSTWMNRLPKTPSITEIEFNPMYAHCIQQIKRMRIQYHRLKRQNSPSPSHFFACVFLYTELFMAVQHKIFFHFKSDKKQALERYWTSVRTYVQYLSPENITTFETQKNIKMMNITGIMDGYMHVNDRKHIFEIKASIKSDWKEDAFIQAFIYALQLGQSWFHIHLMNLFRNEYIEQIIYIDPGVIRARNRLLNDVIIWNMNCFLAKTPNHVRNLEAFCFIHVSYSQQTLIVLSMSSPTRIVIDYQCDGDMMEAVCHFKNYEWDSDKCYIVLSDDDILFHMFPLFLLPKHGSLQTYFPNFVVDDSTIESPVYKLVYIMVSLITIDMA